MGRAHRGAPPGAFAQGKDVGQHTAESARQRDRGAARKVDGRQRSRGQVGAEHETARGAEAIVAVGYRIEQQVGERSDRQGAPNRAGPGGAGGAHEHVGGCDHGATTIVRAAPAPRFSMHGHASVIEREYEVLLNWCNELVARLLAEGQRLGTVEKTAGGPPNL